MSTTLKTLSVTVMAALLAGLLFLSPVGVSNAQTETDEGTTEESTPDAAEGEERRGPRGDLTDEEREALSAEREARRQEVMQALADELGVSLEELTSAMQTVAIAQVEAKLADGEISQERADALIERISSGEVGGFGFGFGGRGGPGHHHGQRA